MRNRVPQRADARWRFRLLSSVAIYAMAVNALAPWAAFAAPASMSNANDANTATPIKHVIVIIGENRTFDHLFATYKPVNKGEKVLNLLSEGIVQANGFPGPNYAAATQWHAQDTTTYQLSPGVKIPYKTLPPPLAGGGFTQTIGGQKVDGQPPFLNVPEAMSIENGLPINYYPFLTTGAVAPTSILGKPDTRIVYDGKLVNNLPPGPYQITPGLYDVYMESPVHRFYQMWQQLDCSATTGSGVCQNDLFPWVEATVGAGSNGKPPPAGFTYKEGATAMGFYNVQQGDVPYFKQLADTYSMSDNFHQSVQGGTGANHIMLGTGDAIWFSDGNGNAAVPPHNQLVAAGTRQCRRCRRDREPRPAVRHQQLVHRGRLWRRLLRQAILWRRQLQRLCRHDTTRRRPGRRLPELDQYQPELPIRALLPLKQLQSRLLRRRHQRLCRQHDCPERRSQNRVYGAAVNRAKYRRRPAGKAGLVRLFRRPILCLPRQSDCRITTSRTTPTATSATSSSTRPRS